MTGTLNACALVSVIISHHRFSRFQPMPLSASGTYYTYTSRWQNILPFGIVTARCLQLPDEPNSDSKPLTVQPLSSTTAFDVSPLSPTQQKKKPISGIGHHGEFQLTAFILFYTTEF
jgi:hypothetical protein